MPLNAPDLPRSDTTALADYAELRKVYEQEDRKFCIFTSAKHKKRKTKHKIPTMKKTFAVMMIPMMMLASTSCQQKVEKVPAIDMTDMDLTVSRTWT